MADTYTTCMITTSTILASYSKLLVRLHRRKLLICQTSHGTTWWSIGMVFLQWHKRSGKKLFMKGTEIMDFLTCFQSDNCFLLRRSLHQDSFSSVMKLFSRFRNIYFRNFYTIEWWKSILHIDLRRTRMNETCIYSTDFSSDTLVRRDKTCDDLSKCVHK